MGIRPANIAIKRHRRVIMLPLQIHCKRAVEKGYDLDEQIEELIARRGKNRSERWEKWRATQ